MLDIVYSSRVRSLTPVTAVMASVCTPYYLPVYSTGDALNAILNYWVEELRMNYIALAIALG